MTAARPALRELAARLSVTPEFRDVEGVRHATRDSTRVALLAAMGFDAASEAGAARALARLDEEARRVALAPVAVEVEASAEARRVRLALPARRGERIEWQLTLRCEDGQLATREGAARVPAHGSLALALRGAPPLGYHALRVSWHGPGGSGAADQLRAVAPRAGARASERLGRRRAFGLCAQLYTLRSRGDWGVGSLSDLGRLAAAAAAEGAAFVGVNPLHALRDGDACPYSPLSRLYRHPLYADPAAVPEFRRCPPAQALAAGPAARALRGAARIDHAAAAALSRTALRQLHQRLRRESRGGASRRARALRAFRAAEGEPLERFATFLALADHLAPRHGRDWRRWPARYRRPGSHAVAAFRERHAVEVDFHCFVQFEIERQLAAAERRARALPLGIYGDLAVGSAPDGADTWSFPGLFGEGATIGAPPDPFSRAGQDWNLAPVVPARLREQGYAFFVRLLRGAFAHCGALRIDHAMGLCRQFWIPAGRPAAEGAYVLQPERELMLLLALESRRAGAVTIAEDLGTVPAGFASRLARRGVLSSRVLYFERDGERFRPARRYPARALVTANTHDLVPLAGLARGSDLELRRRAGAIASEAELTAARAARRRDFAALLARLRRDRLLPASREPDAAALVAAVTAFLCRTPAALVGLSLDDLTAEEEPQNLPGVPPARHASWQRRLSVALEQLAAQPCARAAFGAVPISRRVPAQNDWKRSAARSPRDSSSRGSNTRRTTSGHA